MIEEKDMEEKNRVGFLVSEGASCTCSFAVNPAPQRLKVISQQKYWLGETNSKLLATTKDNNTSALNFGNCKMPDPSHPVPCTANLNWMNYYTEIKLSGNAYPLTENSVATCIAKGGIVRIVKHGQDRPVSSSEMDNTTSEPESVNDPEEVATEDTACELETDEPATVETKPGGKEDKHRPRGKRMYSVQDDTTAQQVRPGELITFSISDVQQRVDKWELVGEAIIISATDSTITIQGNTPGTDCGVIACCGTQRLRSAMIAVRPNRLKVVEINRDILINDLLLINLNEYFELRPTITEQQQVKWYCSTDQSFENYYGHVLSYSFGKEGVYRLEPYLDCIGKELTIVVTVKRPRLMYASWRDGLGYMKFVTGWKEHNHLSLVFEQANNQDVLISFGAHDLQAAKQVILQNDIKKKVINDRVNLVFTADMDKMKMLREGMYFFATVKFVNPHYTSAQDRVLQPAKLLRLKCDPEIIAIRFFKNGKQVFKAAYGETLEGKVWSRNLVYKDLTVEIYRKEARTGIDWLRNDTMVFSCNAYVNSDGFACFKFKLDSSFKDNYKEDFHSFYVKVKEQKMGGVNAMILAFPEPTDNRKKNGKAASLIQQVKIKGKKTNCEACNKEITIAEIQDICKDAKGRSVIQEMKHINGAIDFLNNYREKSGLTRCIRKAHFLAQLAEETKFYKLGEQFNYSATGLMETFSRFRSAEGQKRAEKWGRSADSTVPVSEANQVNIANWVYAGINGNSKDVEVGDGWRYRGKGFIQLTGKSNYKEASGYFNKYFGAEQKDWVANPDALINDPKDAMATALVFWRSRQLNARADTGVSEASLSFVTKPLNDALKNFNERAYFFERAVQTLNVNNCIHYIASQDQKGSIVVVRGTGHHYVKGFVVYETLVWRNLTLERYQQDQKSNSLRDPDFITYLSRDAWDTKCYDKEQKKNITVKHDDQRYGSNNEAPPGTYYLFVGNSGQKYSMYLGDSPGNATINGPHGERSGIAIHHYSPDDSQGCLTTVSNQDLYPIKLLKEEIPDLIFQPKMRPVRIILEERKVEESVWKNKENGTIRWEGIL